MLAGAPVAIATVAKGGAPGLWGQGEVAPPSLPPSGDRGAAEGMLRAGPEPGPGEGGAGSADSVRAAAAAPGLVPAICLSLRPAEEGEGRPGGTRELPQPPASGPRAQGPVRQPHGPETPPLPWRSPGLSGPLFPPAPHPSDRRPSREAARSQRHPHPHPSHDLKRRKWCPAPSLTSADPGALRLPSTSEPLILHPRLAALKSPDSGSPGPFLH